MSAEPSSSGPSDAELARAIPPAAGAHELRVGVFVILGIVSFMTVLFLMTDPASFRGRYIVTTVVDDAGGIRKGDPVQMKGVNIGRVHAFEIRDADVAVALEIEGEWDIPSDSRSQLSSSGLLGGLTVEILRGSASTNLQEGATIPGQSGGNLMDTASELGGQAEAVLGQIRNVLSDGTVNSIEASATELQTLIGTLSQIANQQRAELATLTASLNRTASDVETATPDLQRAVARADSLMGQLSTTATVLSSASRSLDQVLARMAAGEGSLGRLSTDEELYENLNDASIALEALLVDLRENPGRYLKISVF